jgi:subtilisin family serine protease
LILVANLLLAAPSLQAGPADLPLATEPFALVAPDPIAPGEVRHVLARGRGPAPGTGRIRLLDPLPGGFWTARVTGPVGPGDLRAAGVEALHAFPAPAKVSPTLLAGAPLPWAREDGGRVAVAVIVHAGVPLEAGAAAIERAGGRVEALWPALRACAASLPVAGVLPVAADDGVLRVEEVPAPLGANNDLNRVSSRSDLAQQAPDFLTGTGVRVLIYDVGPVNALHTDLGGRVTLGESMGSTLHSTHVAGTLAGSGANSGGRYKGMAPSAHVISYTYENCTPRCLYNNPLDLLANFTVALQTHGADFGSVSLGTNIATNGYPCAYLGDYEITCALLDGIARGSIGAPFLSIWSAGNERGPIVCGTSYGTMGVPGTAKNVISVGGINGNDDSMTTFSSFGPCDDGRLKPDIVAPGCEQGGGQGVTSTFPGGGYATLCGTSMATPTVAGVTALLLERIRRDFPGRRLLPETVKALLAATARDLGPVGPDFQFGHGCVDALAAVRLGARQGFWEGALSDQETATLSLWLPTGSPSLRVALAWSDPPATPGASRALVNDLDLELVSPSGALVLPLVPDPALPQRPAERRRDGWNNLEEALVEAPEAGSWRLRVRGTAVPVGPQTWSLAWTGPGGAVTAHGPAVGGQEVAFRLRAPGGAGRRYAFGLSMSTTPGIPVGGRTVPLTPDWLFLGSQMPSPLYRGFTGQLTAQGEGTAWVRLPMLPAAIGRTFYAAFVTEDPQQPGGLGFISDAVGVTVLAAP